MTQTLSLPCLVFLTIFAQVAYAADPIVEAKQLFERYVSLSAQFDPAVADLYADDALIHNKRTYPDGQVREITIPALQYKQLLREVMPLARARNDTSTYSKTTFKVEGMGVRIQAQRFSVMKQYTSPISLRVAPDVTGHWLIREELSESRPL